MFIVIWGHVIQYTNVQEGLNNKIAAFIYSFHMPMFMMLSGIFFHKQIQSNIAHFLIKNFKRLLLPALFIDFSLFVIIFIHKPRGVTESIEWLWNCRPWFITTLFIFNVLTFLVYKITKHLEFSFIITFVLFCTIPSISDRLIFMYPFFVMGHYIKRFISYNKIGYILLAIFIICLILGINTPETTIYVTPYTVWSIGEGLHFDKSLLIAIKRYFIGFCGSIGIFFILKNIFTSFAKSFCYLNIVQFCGKNTLGLYLLQIVLFTLYMGLSNEVLSNLTFNHDWIAFILSVIVMVVLCFCIKIIQNSKLLKLLILGES